MRHPSLRRRSTRAEVEGHKAMSALAVRAGSLSREGAASKLKRAPSAVYQSTRSARSRPARRRPDRRARTALACAKHEGMQLSPGSVCAPPSASIQQPNSTRGSSRAVQRGGRCRYEPRHDHVSATSPMQTETIAASPASTLAPVTRRHPLAHGSSSSEASFTHLPRELPSLEQVKTGSPANGPHPGEDAARVIGTLGVPVAGPAGVLGHVRRRVDACFVGVVAHLFDDENATSAHVLRARRRAARSRQIRQR